MSKETTNEETTSTRRFSLGRFLFKCLALMAGAGLSVALLIAIAVSLTWPNLPQLTAMTDYRPRIPLRIFTADNILIGEYGEERRNVLRFQEIPLYMKEALISAEDNDFYHHGGVDWAGVVRAALANLVTGSKSQGASTITMQVARNFYLSSEKSFLRKFYEILLTYKIEDTLSKDQILELYLNQIYLGNRSYGFASASRVYFGIPLSEASLAQMAVLAGIPKAPSRFNPKANLKRALERQHYVLERMLKLGYITKQQYDQAINEPIVVQSGSNGNSTTASISSQSQYVAELARQLMYNIYKDNTYSRGLNVYTTVNSEDQKLAYEAVRDNIMQYTRRHAYTGPEEQIQLPSNIEKDPTAFSDVINNIRDKYPDSDDIQTVIVLSASANKVVVARDAITQYELSGKALGFVKRALNPNTSAKLRIQRGSVVYIQKVAGDWTLINMPNVEAAFVALNPNSGAIQAMMGGFDFNRGDFNRVTQAWRQPGSTFKPFIYSAALERGLTPNTNISDQPFSLSASQTGSKPWNPKNYGNQYEPSLTLRQGLQRSKNMVSIRILQAVGPQYAYQFISRFGFDKARQPPSSAYLTMALGAGSVTPLQMASAYSVFANGGYRVNPYIIDHVSDMTGKVIMKAQPLLSGNEANRVIDPRTAYVASDLLRSVAKSGTAARTQATLKRSDIAGKTGTTNNSNDAWFAGFTPKVVGIAWMGFDQPRSLGDRETGGGLSMPIWLSYMKTAIKSVPFTPPGPMPAGLSMSGGNYYFKEFPPGKAISSLGLGDGSNFNANPDNNPYKPKSDDQLGQFIQSLNPTGGAPIRF